MQGKQLKQDTIKGLLWTFGDFFSSKGISFILQIFLARFLLPEHFGQIGMILIIIAISQSIVNSGMQNALIREKESTQLDYSTVFYFNSFISLTLYGVIFFSAPFISDFYSEPVLTSVLRVLGVIVIINAISIVQRTILIKKIDFKTQTLISIVSVFTSGLIAIGFAIGGLGVWSLVVQNVVNQLMQTVLLVLHNKWFPNLIFSFSSFKRLFGFGWKLLVAGLIDTIYKNIFNVIIGRTYSTSTLGYYTQALMLSDIASQSITSAVQKVTFPVLSKIQDNEILLKLNYSKIIKYTVFITFPLMIGLATIAETLIPILLGEKWKGSIKFFQILCFAGMFYPLHAINLNILQVMGRSDLFLKLEVFKKIIGFGLILIVISFDLKVTGLVWTLFISSVISYFINSYYSGNLINYTTINQLKDITKSLVSSIIMGVLVLIIGSQLDMLSKTLLLLIQISFGVISFLVLSLILKSSELKILLKVIQPFIKKFLKNN